MNNKSLLSGNIAVHLTYIGAPFGQVPYIEIDGVKLSQANTIARFLARKYRKSLLPGILPGSIKPILPDVKCSFIIIIIVISTVSLNNVTMSQT